MVEKAIILDCRGWVIDESRMLRFFLNMCTLFSLLSHLSGLFLPSFKV